MIGPVPVWWCSRTDADVPGGEAWLGPTERVVAARLVARATARRQQDWRLGRWTARRAAIAALDLDPVLGTSGRLEVVAGEDGAPGLWLDGAPLPLDLSISHRAGRAVAAVTAIPSSTSSGADPVVRVGADLELVEPRSDAFVAEWLAAEEQALVGATPPDERPRLVNLLWTAKEAAAKVLHQGLRLDVRHAVVDLHPAGHPVGDPPGDPPGDPAGDAPGDATGGPAGDRTGDRVGGSPDTSAAPTERWAPLAVDCNREGRRIEGWWTTFDSFVLTIATDPASPVPPERR